MAFAPTTNLHEEAANLVRAWAKRNGVIYKSIEATLDLVDAIASALESTHELAYDTGYDDGKAGYVEFPNPDMGEAEGVSAQDDTGNQDE